MAQERPRNYFVGVFEKSETFFWKICARSERYINILAGIFEIPPFLWKHRVSIVTGLSTGKQNPTLFQSIVSRKMVCRALIIGVGYRKLLCVTGTIRCGKCMHKRFFPELRRYGSCRRSGCEDLSHCHRRSRRQNVKCRKAST